MRTVPIILSLMLVFSSVSFADETLKFALGEWPPYTSQTDPKGKLAETIVAESFKLQNINVAFEYHAWEDSYDRAKRGKADGTFPWSRTKHVSKDFIVCKEAILQNNEVFFHLKSVDFEWENFNDLKKYRIGGTAGYSHVSILESNGIKVHTVLKEESNFKKLLAGEIDVCPANFVVGYKLIHKLFEPDKVSLFTNHSKSLFKEDLVMLISKKISIGRRMADNFDRGLKQLKESGRYDEIIADFFGVRQRRKPRYM